MKSFTFQWESCINILKERQSATGVGTEVVVVEHGPTLGPSGNEALDIMLRKADIDTSFSMTFIRVAHLAKEALANENQKKEIWLQYGQFAFAVLKALPSMNDMGKFVAKMIRDRAFVVDIREETTKALEVFRETTSK